MNMKSLVLAALFAACAVGAEEFKLNKPADWLDVSSVTFAGETMTVKGKKQLLGKRMFDVDPAKTYELELDARCVGTEPSYIFAGFQVFDAAGKEITCGASAAEAGTETVLTKPIQKGDTEIAVKDASKWKKGMWRYLAFNVKADCSDLPNDNIIPINIKEVRKSGDGYVVVAEKGMSRDVPAGTTVRVHRAGGYMYTAGLSKLASDKFVKLKGKAKGVLKFGFQGSAWPRGAAKARVLILVNWDNAKAASELKDVELEISAK